jgi:hypothetical protein
MKINSLPESGAKKTRVIVVVAAVLLSPILISLAIVVVFSWILGSACLATGICLLRSLRGIRFLVVYSDSAQWKDYFEHEVIPSFGKRAHAINLSTEGGNKTKWDLDWWIYRHCGQYRNRFPLVVRFSVYGSWNVIRFYDAFILSKKGKSSALSAAKAAVATWASEHA